MFSREKRGEQEENQAGAGRKRCCPAQPIETVSNCAAGQAGCVQNAFWVKSPCGAVRDETGFPAAGKIREKAEGAFVSSLDDERSRPEKRAGKDA